MVHNGYNYQKVMVRNRLAGIVLLLSCFLVGGNPNVQAKTDGFVQEIRTFSEDGGSAVLITLTGLSDFKVIPVEDREILIALKDTGVSDKVFGNESIVGDGLVKRVEVTHTPSNVTCVVIRMHKSNSEVSYRTKESRNALRIELRDRNTGSVHTPGTVGLESGKQSVAAAGLTDIKEPAGGDAAPVVDGGPDMRDAKIFNSALEAFKKERWDEAVEFFESIIQSYPKSKYLESVYFLLAKSFHQKFKNDMAGHLIDIIQQYQLAVSTFPESKHVPDALLSMGNCYFLANQYHEAAAYYNLIARKHESHPVAPEAMFQQGRVLAATQKPLMALKLFEGLQGRYPQSPFVLKAELETAKTLFTLKSFNRSLRILDDMKEKSPAEVHSNPDILLYSGYNYYELGRLRPAREVLSKALNLFPHLETPDLILTRIADSFREDGMTIKAMKLYDLVARTYPDSEGSAISLIRVAEEAEKAIDDDSRISDEGISEEKTSKSAHEIYRQVTEKFPDSPLAHVAMLKQGNLEMKAQRFDEAVRIFRDLLAKQPDGKLQGQIETALQDALLKSADISRKDGRHVESVTILTELLTGYPQTPFMAEVKASLEDSLSVIFKQYERQGDMERLIGDYERLQAAVPFEDMPAILLRVGRAYRNLHLYGAAVSVLEKARHFYGKKDLPPNALFGLAESAHKEKRLDLAEQAAEAFVQKNPLHERVSEAYLMLGDIGLIRRDFKTALDFLNTALTKNPDRNTRISVMLAKGRASTALADYDAAVTCLQEAITLLDMDKDRSSEDLARVYRELGEARVGQGEKDKALVSFKKALELHPQGPNLPGLQFRLAQCYQWTKAWGLAEELLTRIVTAGDPFWSKVAQAQINEINIQESMNTLNPGLNAS